MRMNRIECVPNVFNSLTGETTIWLKCKQQDRKRLFEELLFIGIKKNIKIQI